MTKWPWLSTAVLAGCTAQALSIGGGQPLEKEDVDEVPAGAAQGAGASGAYLFTDFSVERCSCRDGNEEDFGCALRWDLLADGLWLDQAEGALSASPIFGNTIDRQLTLAGGIETDGTFEIGAAWDIQDDTTVGQGFALIDGKVDPQTSIDATWSFRAQYLDDSVGFDCDLDFHTSLVWWSPDTTTGCSSDDQCHPEQPYCIDEMCSAGMPGATCTFDDDCAGSCVDGTCVAGQTGDPCAFPNDCASGVCSDDGTCAAPGSCGNLDPCPGDQICFAGTCQDGVEGDPCEVPIDCDPDHTCVFGTCHDGNEGDPCAVSTDCAFESRHCIDNVCYDGSAGDPCETAVDCDLAIGLACGPAGVCE